MKKLLTSLVLVVFSVFVLVSCDTTTSYTVTFESNGGSTVESIITEGGLIEAPEDPTRDGYVFAGWYEDEDFTDPFDFETETVDSDLTLYAKWEDVLTVAEMIALCEAQGSTTSTARYYVQGTITSIENATYGSMYIEDETGSIYVYGTYSADGTLRYSEMDEVPVAGDTVLLYGNVQLYSGTPEIYSGWIISFTANDPEITIEDYTVMTIAEAREAAVGTLVNLTGVVAQITVNSNQNATGFILVDGTSSIYVYDSQIAPRVSVGNTVNIVGERDNWILSSESTYAATFGYEGCIQVANCTLIDNDGGSSDWDHSWVEETTVKTLIDLDVSSENVTSKIYKVNALVKEVPGSGFTNFYFFDIDGATGSYVYTQASGEDFTWLREFDGKICTVYLMVLNYRSSSSGVLARFLPVEVIDEDYEFDLSTTAQMVLDYYVKDQFVTDSYYADPALELVGSVSNETLGFEGVTISYESDNDAVTFTYDQDTATWTMNVDATNPAIATIIVTISYEDQIVNWQFTINVSLPDDYDYISVSDALSESLVGETITVRGIVGPSLVNRTGFYLMSEEGMIAIITDSATMTTINLGDEVILTGVRTQFNSGDTWFGQTCITDAVIEVNLYGNNEIPTDFFLTGYDLEYLYNLDASEDHTTEVYIVTATVNYIETAYYTSLSLSDGTTTFNLYMASASQYSFLADFAGEEVTLAIALCNWNNRTYYRGCVLYVQDSDGNIIYNELNFS